MTSGRAAVFIAQDKEQLHSSRNRWSFRALSCSTRPTGCYTFAPLRWAVLIASVGGSPAALMRSSRGAAARRLDERGLVTGPPHRLAGSLLNQMRSSCATRADDSVAHSSPRIPHPRRSDVTAAGLGRYPNRVGECNANGVAEWPGSRHRNS